MKFLEVLLPPLADTGQGSGGGGVRYLGGADRPSPDPEQNSKFYLEIIGGIEDRRVVLYRVGATAQECMQHAQDNWMINILCFLTLTSSVPFEMLEF